MKKQSGQAVLIVLLSMAVVLTIVLSILAASTTDIKLSTNESQSLRAFSAAEAGIEKALVANTSSNGTIGSANFTANVTGLAQGQTNYVYPQDVANGDSGILWFVAHDSTGSLVCNQGSPCFTGRSVKVCWGKPGTAANAATTPAVEISVYYLSTPGDYSTAKVAKAIYDPNNGRIASNSYSPSDNPGTTCTVGSSSYAFQKTIDLSSLGVAAGVYSVQNGLQFMPIKMLYNSAESQPLGIDLSLPGNSTIPSQGNQVDSTGTVDQASRKIQVSKGYGQVPSIFDAAIFSPSQLVQ
ncbi:MAG TPA: hypothetical protein VLE44_03470 [Candidatus Saccharimonadales bacterium]|nr:hypothetical protein [Candidatus Saccharimonadales bacterium]